jgi:uncharacterized membrane protein YsdA (DUF1294 family)
VVLNVLWSQNRVVFVVFGLDRRIAQTQTTTNRRYLPLKDSLL